MSFVSTYVSLLEIFDPYKHTQYFIFTDVILSNN
jgi:hypothetical protein